MDWDGDGEAHLLHSPKAQRYFVEDGGRVGVCWKPCREGFPQLDIGDPWAGFAVFVFEDIPKFESGGDVFVLIGDGVVEAEAYVASGFDIVVLPFLDKVLPLFNLVRVVGVSEPTIGSGPCNGALAFCGWGDFLFPGHGLDED